MSKKEINAAKAEITELRRLFRRIYPSGNRKYPDRFWEQIRRLSEHVQWLEDLSTPLPARATAVSNTVNVDLEEAAGGKGLGGRSAQQPVFPGVRLIERDGDRNLYHHGREYQTEIDQIYRKIKAILDQSADWLRGLDLDPEDIPTTRRPRCGCGELLATTWRYCPYCTSPIAP